MKRHLMIRNEIPEISHLAPFVEEIGEELELTPGVVSSLTIVLEEAISNIISYAYTKENEGDINILADVYDNMLVFTITDSGKEFDPTSVPEADITLSAEDRQIGGLGVYLIKKIMNEVVYQRVEGINVFTLKKTFK